MRKKNRTTLHQQDC